MKSKSQLQQEYCELKKLPMFAPDDGICFSCDKNIYDKLTEEQVSTELITGCPFCNTSYCE
jgi:hypothetical protein